MKKIKICILVIVIQSCSLMILNHSKPKNKIETKVFQSDTLSDNQTIQQPHNQCDHYDLFPQPTLYPEKCTSSKKNGQNMPTSTAKAYL